MHVETAGVVLFLHIAVAIVAFAMAGVLHSALQVFGRARRVEEVRTWAAVAHRIEPLFPVMALLLLGLGAWLVHLGKNTDDKFSFSTGWILTAIVTLVVVEAIGGAVLAPRGKKLNGLIAAAPDGEVTDEIRAAARDPLFWDMAHLTTFGFLGVVFIMAAKPDGAWAVVFPVVGAVLGVVLSRWQLRSLPAYDAPATVPGQRAQSPADTEAAH
ncbi:MAG: hypothetical protein QOG34_2386 [Frankiaceae bacterium]|nr:hypothetical protein [Frankiaceae bacterium]